MKTLYKAALAAATLLLAASCAEEKTTTINDSNKEFIQAWIETNYPAATQTREDGVWILQDTPGTGQLISRDEDYYIFVDYIRETVGGTIEGTNIENVARQIGSYKNTSSYGYTVWSTMYSLEGILQTIDGMRVGGTRKVLVPGWLMTYETFDNYSDLYKEVKDGTNTVYTITVKDVTPDIKAWQGDRLDAWSKENLGGVDSTAYTSDESSFKFGFYLKTLKEPVFGDSVNPDEFSMPNDTIVFINYTGRFLDGKVFDTSVANVAKDAGIYDATKTYGPQQITWNSEPERYYMGDQSSTTSSTGNLQPGFYYALSHMRPYEKIVTAFWSGLGYGVNGNSPTIPGYCPLVFEIEMVDNN